MAKRLQMSRTKFRHHAKELAKAKDAVDSANRAKSEFLANVSHGIRTRWVSRHAPEMGATALMGPVMNHVSGTRFG